MKIIRDNICFVNFKDLIFFDFPVNLDFDKKTYNENDYVILKSEKDIDYVRKREDIIDYDYVSSLTDDELTKKIGKIEKNLEPLYIEFSSTSNESKKMLFEDEEFKNNLFKLDKIYYDLIHYRNNKEIIDQNIFDLLIENNVSKSLIKF